MLAWTVEAAAQSGAFQYLIGSTNSDKIMTMLDDLGCVPLRSDLHDLPDGSPIVDISREVVQKFCFLDFDTVVVLQPTSPFRTADDIRGALALMEERDADAVVAVCDCLVLEIGHADRLRPSERSGVVMHNGAFYAVKRSVLEAGKDWDTADLIYAYYMPRERSIDIDTVYDIEAAQRMLEVAA
jgi:CMP-N,N'-diacetyllegionaminic acid synthase